MSESPAHTRIARKSKKEISLRDFLIFSHGGAENLFSLMFVLVNFNKKMLNIFSKLKRNRVIKYKENHKKLSAKKIEVLITC